jgi:hypothetical protein
MTPRLLRLLRTVALPSLLGHALAGGANAQPMAGEGCFDASGRSVISVDTPDLPVLAKAAIEGGEPVLRVNTSVIAGLSPRAQLFFYAHECARHALGHPLSAAPTLERARRADCWALATLRGSGALDEPGAVQALEAELRFSAEQWRLLPGPVREVELTGCRAGSVLRLPAGGPPTPALESSNRCIHACGDRLWQCQNRCAEAGCRGRCEAVYDDCEARCPAP